MTLRFLRVNEHRRARMLGWDAEPMSGLREVRGIGAWRTSNLITLQIRDGCCDSGSSRERPQGVWLDFQSDVAVDRRWRNVALERLRPSDSCLRRSKRCASRGRAYGCVDPLDIAEPRDGRRRRTGPVVQVQREDCLGELQICLD